MEGREILVADKPIDAAQDWESQLPSVSIYKETAKGKENPRIRMKPKPSDQRCQGSRRPTKPNECGRAVGLFLSMSRAMRLGSEVLDQVCLFFLPTFCVDSFSVIAD